MSWRWIILIFLLPVIGVAQIFPREEPRLFFWASRGSIRFEPNSHSFVSNSLDGRGSEVHVGLGAEYQPIAFFNELYWVNNKLNSTKASDRPIRRILSTSNGQTWDLEGWIRLTEDVDVDAIHPLKGDRFLLIAFTRIRVGDRYSKFAIARRNEEKELLVDRLLDMGLESPWGIPRDEATMAGHFGVNPVYNELFIAGFPVLRTPSHLAVVGLRAGYVWLMDLDREAPAFDLLKIHSGIKDSMLGGQPHLDHCVLDAQPTREGRFLFATRSERAVLFGAMNLAKPQDVSALKEPLQKTDRAVAQLLNLRDEPDLEWRELDPVEKSIHTVPSPPGVPERLVSLEDIRSFRFWFTKKGNLACTLSTYVPGEAPTGPTRKMSTPKRKP